MDGIVKGAAVVPCFNEAPSIGKLVSRLKSVLPRIIVVDDGSQDSTAQQAAAAGAQVLVHPSNQGKGAALSTGLQAACLMGLEWAVLLDGDGQHEPSDIPRLLACAEQRAAPLVVGNRMLQPHKLPWLRRQVNRAMSRLLSHSLGCPLPDSQCGFRLVDLKVWKSLSLRSRRFEIESEMLAAFLQAGHRVEFVPIQVIGRGPHSHIRPVRDAWRWLRWWSSLPRPLALGLPGPGTCSHLSSR